MSDTAKYTVALAAGLIFFFVSGNHAGSTPRTLSTFPYLLAMLPFPIVLYVLLRQRAKGDDFSVRGGVHSAEKVVRRAAIVFAFFVLVYSYFYFDSESGWLMVAAFFMTLFATWLIGVVFAALCAWVVARRAAGAEVPPAA